MNFFKSAKYKMGGSSKKDKKGSSASSKAEHFNNLEGTAPQKQRAKGKAPATPDNDVTACFSLLNSSPFAWKLKEEGSAFPDEVPAKGKKIVRLSNSDQPCSAKYLVAKNDKTFEIDFKLSKREGKWTVGVEWNGFDDDFDCKPRTDQALEIPGPDSDELTVELAHKSD